MKGIRLCVLLLAMSSWSPASDMLVSPSWLKENLADPKLVLFHVGSRAEFEREHIPGARLVTTADFSLPRSEGALLLELLPPQALHDRLQNLGVGDDSRIVVYFEPGSVTAAMRAYFSLDAAGLGDRSSVLDGGLAAWKDASGPLTDEVKAPAVGTLTTAAREDLVFKLDEVRAGLAASSIHLVDARAPEFFDGTAASPMPRTGHIPGAINIPFQSLTTADQRMKPSSEIAEIFQAVGVKAGDTVVTYCNTGQQASVVYFAARELGLKARLYDGSWDEWSRRADLPVEPRPVR